MGKPKIIARFDPSTVEERHIDLTGCFDIIIGDNRTEQWVGISVRDGAVEVRTGSQLSLQPIAANAIRVSPEYGLPKVEG